MANLIRKILKQTKDIAQWKFLIKNNFNLANVMRNSVDLKLEELRLERTELEENAMKLWKKQRCVESMITDLTRSIKQMEFDIDQMQIQMQKAQTNSKPTPEETHTESPEPRQAANSQQK